MRGWVDLHTHILSGLDDGAQTMEDSVRMAQMAAQCGVQILVTTPHSCGTGRFSPYMAQTVLKKVKQLQEELDRRKIRLLLVSGMEILADNGIGELLNAKQLLPIGDSGYALVEFHFSEDPMRTFSLLHEVREAGYVPLIAHPERYPFLQREPEIAADWRAAGCCLQANKGSLFGQFGPEAEICVRRLLSGGMIDAVASDAHSPVHRTTNMTGAADWLRRYGGDEAVRKMLQENPLKILLGKPVSPVTVPSMEY